MQLYSWLACQLEVPSPEPGPVFEVPPGYRFVLRDVDVAGNTLHTYIFLAEAIADQNFALLSPTVVTLPDESTATSFEWRGRQVFTEGMQLAIGAAFPNAFVRASGYLLLDS